MAYTPKGTGYEPRPRSTPRALLQRLRTIMADEVEPQARLDQLVAAIAANMVADVCSIYVRRADDILELFATEGLKREAVHATRLRMDEGLVGWVARNKKPIKVREAKTHEAFSYRAETGEDPLNGFLGVPIIRSGQVLGILVIQNKAKRDFIEEEIEVAQTVATILAEVVSSGELLEERDREDVEALLLQPTFAKGTPIVAGIAYGHVVQRDPIAKAHPTFAQDVAAEKQRLEDALGAVRKSVDEMMAADKNLKGASREVLEVFRLFAYDKGWARRLEEKVLSGLSAESAVEQVQAENRQRMKAVSDPYLRERMHDLDDLSRRMIRALNGESIDYLDLPEDAILLADALGPAELLELDSTHLKGLVLSEAAGTSHAAIIARSLGIPMVSGLSDIVDKAYPGDEIVMDGSTGEVHLRPPQTIITTFEDKAQLRTQALARYSALKDQPAVTTDGVEIDLQMNAGLLLDMAHLDETGASAIGLFRTELQFLLGRSLPSSAAQEAFYKQILDAAGSREVIFRTADIGSDKRAGYMMGPGEANPAMGWRGLRMALDRQGLMRTQIRALLSAAGRRPLSFMLPLVTTPGELVDAKALVAKELARHERHVGPLPEKISIGAMIEIPSAAWDVKRIAAQCDFLSIGGNDLAQFFFAADRDSESVSARYDTLSSSFLGFLKRTVQDAKETGKPIGYCGEQASDPLMALALIALGIDRLSVSASAIGPLKAMIRSVTYKDLSRLVSDLIEKEPGSIRAQLNAYVEAASIDMG